MNQRTISHPYAINQTFIRVLVIALMSLAISYGVEIYEKLQPCRICQFQRLFFFLIALLSLSGIFLHPKKAIKISILLVSLGSIFLACYHIGVQLNFFTDFCPVGSPNDLNDFKKMLLEKRSACAAIHKIFGIPISVWTLISSLVFIKIIASPSPIKVR